MALVKVTYKGKEFEGESGESVLSITSAKGETIGARCYSGNCYGCIIEVSDPCHALGPRTLFEKNMLKIKNDPRLRLGFQAKVFSDLEIKKP